MGVYVNNILKRLPLFTLNFLFLQHEICNKISFYTLFYEKNICIAGFLSLTFTDSSNSIPDSDFPTGYKDITNRCSGSEVGIAHYGTERFGSDAG